MRVRALIIVAVLLAMAGSAWAINCPATDVVPLKEFTAWGGNFYAQDVAFSPDGNVYVTDSLYDMVTVFGRDGKVVRSLKKTNPYGIKIEDSGTVYIGTGGKVEIYDTSLNYKGELGLDVLELPVGIDTDDTRIYVVDNSAHKVKVFDKTSGELLVSFGGFGYGGGNLARPTGISVQPGGVIYVTDNALQYEQGYGLGAGAHIFTINENNEVTFVKNFVVYGYADLPGYMINPADVTVDASGRVLISDSATSTNNFEMYNADGGYICSYPMPDFKARPTGMDISGEGKLAVAASGRVYIFGIGQYTDMAVTPKNMQFDVQACGDAPGSQSITVSNDGEGVLAWSAAETVSWLDITNNGGDIAKGGSDSVTVSVNAGGLDAGTYAGVIRIGAAGAAEYVNVNLDVAGPPQLSATPDAFSFTVVGNDIPPAESLNVELSGGAGWSATVPSWIAMTPSDAQGGALTVASVGVNASVLANMAGGDYSDVITLDNGCGGTEPVQVAVSLAYIKGGSIEVTSNLTEATYTISGPEAYEGAGMSYRVDGAPEGAYTIMYGAVDGFLAPETQTLTVANGETIKFTGDYVDLRESNSIVLGTLAQRGEKAVSVLDAEGAIIGSFSVASNGRRNAYDETSTAAGDFDGDGLDEIVVSHDDGIVTGYRSDGSAIDGFSFAAFPYMTDVDLSAADLNGDGIDEIIVASGFGADADAAVRVFAYNGGAIVDTGIYFLASAERSGVKVASGDVDGDGIDEIATLVLGIRSATVRIWSADIAGGLSAWTAVDAGGFVLDVSSKSDIAMGDIDASGTDEIIVAANGESAGAAIGVYDATGRQFAGFTASGLSNVSITSGDMNLDGRSEVVVSEVVGHDVVTRVYGADGTLINEIKAFDTMNIKSTRVSLGQVEAR